MSSQTGNNGTNDNIDEDIQSQLNGNSAAPRTNPSLPLDTPELGLQKFLELLGKSHSTELKVLDHIEQLQKDQERILELLRRKFEPTHDTPQIAKGLWVNTENAWVGSEQEGEKPEDQSLGSEFLISLVPGGNTFVPSHDSHGTVRFGRNNFGPRTGVMESNLIRARVVFETWVRHTKRYSSPWKDIYSEAMKSDIDRIQEWWPVSWEYDPMELYGNSQFFSLAALGPSINDPIAYDYRYGQDITSLLETNKYSGFIHIIDLKKIALILCVAGGEGYVTSGGPEFLDGHVSEWRERGTHHRCEMREFESGSSKIEDELGGPGRFYSGVFMHYMRSFIVCDFPPNPTARPLGLKCIRARMSFKGFSDNKTLSLTERRYSTALRLLPFNPPSGHYALCSIIDCTPDLEGRFGIWKWAPGENLHVSDGPTPWKQYGILPAGLYTGVSIFQLQICSFIDSWERDWHATIDQIDSNISIKIDVLEDFERLKALMMGNLSDSSVSYFKVLKLLGIFTTSVKAAPAYLEALIPYVSNPFEIDYWFEKTYPHTSSSKTILKSNWDNVEKRQKEAAERILKRLERTTNEVQGLMDGVFNIQSIQEAQKSRTLNKYLFVFTLLTIIFLPPTLVATFFGTDIFNSSTNDKTEKKFWVSVVTVSVVTYIVAGMGLFGTGSEPERRSQWYQRMRDPEWLLKVKTFPQKYFISHRSGKQNRTDEEHDIEMPER